MRNSRRHSAFSRVTRKVYRKDIVAPAYALCRANAGAPGPDGETFELVEQKGVSAWLEHDAEQRRTKTYRPGTGMASVSPESHRGERPPGPAAARRTRHYGDKSATPSGRAVVLVRVLRHSSFDREGEVKCPGKALVLPPG